MYEQMNDERIYPQFIVIKRNHKELVYQKKSEKKNPLQKTFTFDIISFVQQNLLLYQNRYMTMTTTTTKMVMMMMMIYKGNHWNRSNKKQAISKHQKAAICSADIIKDPQEEQEQQQQQQQQVLHRQIGRWVELVLFLSSTYLRNYILSSKLSYIHFRYCKIQNIIMKQTS